MPEYTPKMRVILGPKDGTSSMSRVSGTDLGVAGGVDDGSGTGVRWAVGWWVCACV